MSFVTIDQFEVRYGAPISDQDRVEALLEDACAQVEDIAGESYTEDNIPAAIVGVVVTAVRRAFDNPGGLIGETIGNYTWQAGRSSGAGVYFTPQELKIIRRAAGKMSVSSLTLEGFMPVVSADQYISDSGSGEPILYYAEEDLSP